ncbi:hypothetical protein Daesc_007834 [Daldinia eschscholtzii]|uniref:Uncharacterized protein n=1 Tax=Daldinia eschscholtzii TaxID=292717 RepID=A0AAX6MFS5_9PEZI
MSTSQAPSPTGSSAGTRPSSASGSTGSALFNSMLGGFSLPVPGFDPSNNHAVVDHYQDKEKKGVLADEDSIETDIEEEAERVVADWEAKAGREATDEEREQMMTVTRSMRNSGWLEGAKAAVAGKTEVPVAWFNHVITEREQHLRFVSNRYLEMLRKRQETNEEIAQLNKELQRLEEDRTNEREELNYRVEELQKEIDELEKNHTAERDQLTAQIAELTAEHSKVQDDLRTRIDELEKEYSTAQDELIKLEDTNKQLEDDKALTQENFEKLEGDRDLLESQLKEARDREERLQEKYQRQESELNVCHRGRRKQEEEVENLKAQLNAARARERPLKDENRALEDEIADLKRQLEEMAKAKSAGPANGLGSGPSNGSGSKPASGPVSSTGGGPINGAGNGSSSGPSSGPGNGPVNGSGGGPGSGVGSGASNGASNGSGNSPTNGTYQFDTIKLLRELKEAKETNSALGEESEELLAHWMARVADEHNLLEFYAAVGDLRQAMTDLNQRIVSFYNSLGNDDTVTSAEDALANLEKQIEEQPKEALGARLWGLKLVAEIHMLKTQLLTQVTRNDTLNMKLEMAKPDEQIEMEVRMNYGIYNEAEIQKRVDSETQTFRVQRREIVGRIFDCANRLEVIAIRCPHQPTQEAIRATSREYLSPLNLPMPRVQPAR